MEKVLIASMFNDNGDDLSRAFFSVSARANVSASGDRRFSMSMTTSSQKRSYHVSILSSSKNTMN